MEKIESKKSQILKNHPEATFTVVDTGEAYEFTAYDKGILLAMDHYRYKDLTRGMVKVRPI